MYSKGGDWTLSLSVRKPISGRGKSDRFKSENGLPSLMICAKGWRLYGVDIGGGLRS